MIIDRNYINYLEFKIKTLCIIYTEIIKNNIGFVYYLDIGSLKTGRYLDPDHFQKLSGPRHSDPFDRYRSI